MTSSFQFELTPRSTFTDLPIAPTPGNGVVACDRDGLGLASVLVRKGELVPLAQHLREHFSIELPQGPYRVHAGDFAIAGTGPGAWLASMEQGGNAFSARLRQMLDGVASVSDQSDGQAVLRLAGPRVRDTLSKLVPIDIHPRAFPIGNVAVTVAAHIGATLWRLDDRADGEPIFEIAVYRSLAASFWHALSASAAEFGFQRSSLPLPATTNPAARPSLLSDSATHPQRAGATAELVDPPV